jgi:plastocyanin
LASFTTSNALVELKVDDLCSGFAFEQCRITPTREFHRGVLFMQSSKRTKTVLISVSAPLLLIIAFVVVIALYSTFHQPSQVTMTASSFAPQHIQINEGESIRFVNQSASLTQVLCVGTNKQCDRSVLTIQELPPQSLIGPNLRIAPGQTENIIFNNAGTFNITSTVVPHMNMTVTVNQGAD